MMFRKPQFVEVEAKNAERQVLYHAMLRAADHPWWRAMCGVTPDRRSNGWSEYLGDAVTCPRCRDLLERFESGGPRYQGLYEPRALD